MDQRPPVVAVLPWGQVIEDYLDSIGVDTEAFLHEMDGGWLFGYIDALATAGVATTIVWPSRSVRTPERRVHARTGTPVWFIPPSRTWRLLRRAVDDPYARHPADAAPERPLPQRWAGAAAHTIIPWVATPVRTVARILRAEHATVILCQDYEEARFDTCVALGRVLNVPVYAVNQGGILQRTPLEHLTRPRAVRAAAGLFIGASSEVRRVQELYDLPSDRICIVPNPLPLDQWPIGDRAAARAELDIPPGAGVVSWHGRIAIAQKGLDLLLDAWEAITSARPGDDLFLLLTGSGQDSEALHAEIERRQPRGVRWLDAYVLDRRAIPLQLAAADVAVLSSRAEGFAVAPLEAMASGRALVASAVPGITDIAPRGEDDGVIAVPPGDARALADALGAVLDHPERAATVGLAARARIADAFSLEVVGSKLAAALGLRELHHSTQNDAPHYRFRAERKGRAVAVSRAAHERERSGTRQPAPRRALTSIARRIGRFLGVSDLSHSVDAARGQIASSQTELSALGDELRRRVQMLEEEQLRLQHARSVWVTCTYLAATPIPEDLLISVVVPTRNRAGVVGRAINSVMAQSYRHWELIVVDDGSDDNTVEVLRAFDDARVSVLHHEHRGLAAARNAGLDKASGAVVVYLDDDNLMYEHWLRGVAWAFSLHPEADVMIGARLIDDEFRGRQLEAGGPPHLSFINRLDRAALRQANQADIMQLAHRRDLPARFDDEDQPYEDWGFLARLTEHREALCFPALAGVYTTTAAGRLMDSDAEMLERQVKRLATKLR